VSEFRALLISETEKARQFMVNERLIWIPRSVVKCITKGPPDKQGQRVCVLDVEDWFCEKEGL